MWREFVKELEPNFKFAEPADLVKLETAEEALRVKLPDELKSLLQECNGIFGSLGLGLVWPIERIVADNLAFRTNADFRELYMPFDPLLFFGDAGNGDQFAFAIQAGIIRRPDIFAWSHEDDSRTWKAPSLARFVEWLLSGRIQL